MDRRGKPSLIDAAEVQTTLKSVKGHI